MPNRITDQTNGGSAIGTDEFIINRGGVDFKLTHTNIMAAVVASLATEVTNRTNADTALDTAKLNKSGGTMTGALVLSGAPTLGTHATTKTYVDAADALLLPLAGGTMSGAIVLAADPTLALHPVTLQYLQGANGVGGRLLNPTNLDCSANPNYPISVVGKTYRVSVAGKIGGGSGKVVQAEDLIICITADTAGGSEASVGSKYMVLQGNLVASTQTDLGYSRFSTDAELDAGTDDATGVTPRGLRRVITRLTEGFNRTIDANTTINVPTTVQSTIYLLTGSASGAVTVNLPQISTITGSKKIVLNFKDAGLMAATNNITLTATGGDLIDGVATFVINSNKQSVTLVTDEGTNWYII